MIYLLPYIISLVIGIAVIRLILHEKEALPFFVLLPLALLVGLSLSSHIIFYSLLCFSKLLPMAVIFLNLSLMIGLLYLVKKNSQNQKMNLRIYWSSKEAAFEWPVLLLLIPIILSAWIFPYGGWDAWASWNVKARFIFLGAEHWKNILNPVNYITNNQYPFLLPLMNVWTWIFGKEALPQLPMTTGIIFCFFTVMLLFSALKHQIKSHLSILPSFVLGTFLTFLLLATDQYPDILISLFLLSCLFCFQIGIQKSDMNYLKLSALLCGFLSFTKEEGLISSAIIFLTGCFILYAHFKKDRLKNILMFTAFYGAGAFPALIFNVFLKPENLRFVNGLTSGEKPATIDRLFTTLQAFFLTLFSKDWHGIILATVVSILYGFKKIWYKENLIITLYLLFYLSIVIANYWINTYLDITWWLNNSLNRVIITILPVAMYLGWKNIFESRPTKIK